MVLISSRKHFLFSRFLSFFFIIWFWGKIGLIREITLISKLIAPQSGSQIITIHKMPNMSRGSGNQTMKFGQLI